MTDRLTQRHSPLSDQVLDILVERIRAGVYPPGSRLPSESCLAGEFAVSRATIRSALTGLAARGLLLRRQGDGTYVSSRTVRNPLSEFIAFPQLIASNGLEPGFRQIEARITTADAGLAERMLVEPGEEVLTVRKLFTADGTPVIYVINHIPAWVYGPHLSPEEAVQPGVTEPILEFLEQRCGQSILHFAARVRAETMATCNMSGLDMPYDANTPVLVIDEVAVGQEGKVIHHSVEHHPDNWMIFELIRSRGLLPS